MDFRKFEKIDSKASFLGYGCMRFPTKDDKIDEEQSIKLLKAAVEGGVNYFDTAYIYHNSDSERFLGDFLANHINRPRESYYIATKLPTWEVNSLDDAKRIFAEQLKRLQASYVDFYMLHDLKLDRFEKMEKLGVYEYCRELQKEGKIRHFGHSSHENSDNFAKIVAAREWDFVMLQLNYMDLDNMKLYDICEEKGIPVLAMEAVRGGSLAKLPDNILAHFTAVEPSATPASWAIRWVGGLSDVKVILSGMSDMQQVEDNLNTCSNFKPLNAAEELAVKKVESDLRKRVFNSCTGCNYCMPCPAGVNIPWCLSIYNDYGIYENRGHTNWIWGIVPEESKPAKCTDCGKCSQICPQGIDVVDALKRANECMNSIR